MAEVSEFLTVPKASKESGIPIMTLYRRIKSGKVLAHKVGGFLFIPQSEVDRLKKGKDNVC